MILILTTLFLAIVPQYSYLILGLILLGELFLGNIEKEFRLPKYHVEISCVFFLIYLIKILIFGANPIIDSLLIGTIGLSITHDLYHKWGFLKGTVFYRYHSLHHNPRLDPERKQREKGILKYILIRIVCYLNPLNWKLLDAIIFGCILLGGWNSIFTFFLALCIIEFIGFHQHSIDNKAVSTKNKMTNLISNNSGFHFRHHGEENIYHWDYGVIVGFLSSILWLVICLSLYPLLFIKWPKANFAGAYLFGFSQNVGNYIEANGRSINNLLYRTSSVFDKPKLIFQYLNLMFRNEKKELQQIEFTGDISTLDLSHDLSAARNIYNIKDKENDVGNVIVFNNQVIEGHHRIQAKCKVKIVEIA